MVVARAITVMSVVVTLVVVASVVVILVVVISVLVTMVVVTGPVGSVVMGGGLVWMLEGIDSTEILGRQKVIRLLFLTGYRLHSR